MDWLGWVLAVVVTAPAVYWLVKIAAEVKRSRR